jgi:Recombinase
MADELNRRGIPTVFGASWNRTTIARMLTRLGIANRSIGRTSKRVADVRAEAVGPTIRKLRNAGFVSITAIARELNERGILAARGGKWHLSSVTRLLQRLERLDRISHSQRRR